MPSKIVFIGAGSVGFTRKLVRDCLTFPALQDAHLALVDIDPTRLALASRACRRLIDAGGHPATVSATQDRKAALDGADAVLCTILSGGVEVWQHDILIPKQFGVDINVGDTRGPAGVFRALRTLPEMLAICADMEALCPDALLLNYTNPMAMLCQGMLMRTRVRLTGLCHSVQSTARMLAGWLDVPEAELAYVCAGLNHLSWYLRLEHQGRNLYPALRDKVLNDTDVYNHEPVRNELFLALDHYVTESSGHNSEYNWWFRKRPDLIAKYCTGGTSWNPGEHAFMLKRYRNRETTWEAEIHEWIDSPDWRDPEACAARLARGREYAAAIINAWLGGDLYRYNGNTLNTGGLIGNLPHDCCVEVPVLASRRCLQPMPVGHLPRQVLPLTGLTASCETLAVEGALSGDPRKVFQSIANDPLTAAVLSLGEIRELVNAMFDANRDYLPHFRTRT